MEVAAVMSSPLPPSRFTPISIAPRPPFSTSTPIPTTSHSPSTTTTNTTPPSRTFQSINKPSDLIATPTREYWSEASKYDLLWSIVVASGTTLTTIPWDKIHLPSGHTQQSAATVLQDIALGKHHITHPTFTPSNSSGSSVEKKFLAVSSGNSNHVYDHDDTSNKGSVTKKRKLDDRENDSKSTNSVPIFTTAPPPPLPAVRVPEREQSTGSSEHSSSAAAQEHTNSTSPLSAPSSPSDSHPEEISTAPPTNNKNQSTPRPRRRHRSDSPPLELDLTNPKITNFLKKEGYMNDDGTPAKRKRGRPTKDPFGLSVTLKKQLMRLDPNAPPMKKRGRPRKRFLDVDIDSADLESMGTSAATDRDSIRGDADKDIAVSYRTNPTGKGTSKEEIISPDLKLAIEKIGEEMDREVEGMLRGDDVSDGSEGYEGSVAEVWETGGESDEEERRKGDTDTDVRMADWEEAVSAGVPFKRSAAGQMAIDAVIMKT
ncbi:hypothetical protein H072_3457 [Dactylellina haptotyla CBS 200.50]|uniref:Uncharacterized protein n=1 Tax=Dactylellina haptotyla (strain CBS 200.50) TaxID=1284197 RepID=S8BSW0_DACHA|nr:hypothetical protein H072_3457 [Dactylellina haptotyla CBS 200.50]